MGLYTFSNVGVKVTATINFGNVHDTVTYYYHTSISVSLCCSDREETGVRESVGGASDVTEALAFNLVSI